MLVVIIVIPYTKAIIKNWRPNFRLFKSFLKLILISLGSRNLNVIIFVCFNFRFFVFLCVYMYNEISDGVFNN